jgi:hypothetical protein
MEDNPGASDKQTAPNGAPDDGPDTLTDIPQINGGTGLNLPPLGRSDKPAPSPPAFDRCLGTRPAPSRARNPAVAVIKTAPLLMPPPSYLKLNRTT